MLIGDLLNGLREAFRRGFFAGASGPRGGLPDVGYKSGDYCDSILSGAITSGAVAGANNAYCLPFVARSAQTFDRIALENTGTGDNGDKIRFYIVQDNGGTPLGGAVLANPAEITLDGTAKDNAATISLTLTKGQLVWIGVVVNATVTTRNIVGGVGDISWSSLLGNFLGSFAVASFFRTDFTYGAAPDPFTTGVSVVDSGGAVPRIRLRAQ